MEVAAIPKDEAARLAALESYQLAGTPPEKDFDELAELASKLCDVPMSAITLIDTAQQWLKAKVGLPDSVGPREEAFCAHTILQDEMMIVPDATKDKRFVNNPLVTGNPDIRFYAGMPLINEDGFKLGSLCVIDTKPRQLTETQKSYLTVLAKQVVQQMELRRKVSELERLNDANSKLMSVISHDLRSPLGSLYGLLEMVERYGLTHDEFRNMIPDVKKGFVAANGLLTNLLEWASSQFSQGEAKRAPVFLRLLVDQVIKGNELLFEKKGNKVLNRVAVPTMVFVNDNMVKAIVRNLLLNANKFTSDGTLTISAEEKNGLMEVCVADTGAGMPPDRLARLFSWETRSSTVGTQGEKGSGFGLQLCKEFAEKSGGRLWASSEEGKGSSFYFTLPVS